MATQPTEAQETPLKESPLELVERLGDAWRSRDGARVAALCTPDVVWRISGVPEPMHGREAGRAWLDGFFAAVPDVTFDFPLGPPYLAPNGSGLAARWRWNGTMLGPMNPPGFAPTGARVSDEGIDVYELEDGQISRYTMVFDPLGFARQIGGAPAPGSPAERVGVAMQRLAAWRERRRHRPPAGP